MVTAYHTGEIIDVDAALGAGPKWDEADWWLVRCGWGLKQGRSLGWASLEAEGGRGQDRAGLPSLSGGSGERSTPQGQEVLSQDQAQDSGQSPGQDSTPTHEALSGPGK